MNDVASLNVRMGHATFCVAKDSDARQPYVAANLDVRTGSIVVGSDTFSTIAECNNFLGLR